MKALLLHILPMWDKTVDPTGTQRILDLGRLQDFTASFRSPDILREAVEADLKSQNHWVAKILVFFDMGSFF